MTGEVAVVADWYKVGLECIVEEACLQEGWVEAEETLWNRMHVPSCSASSIVSLLAVVLEEGGLSHRCAGVPWAAEAGEEST